jgi:Uma2 family endonuclease
VGEVGIYTERNPDSVRAADVLLISNERLDRTASDGFLDVAPALVAEMMSPSNPWEEMRRTLHEYFGIGVDVVWGGEPFNRSVQVYRGIDDVRTLGTGDVLDGEGLLEALSIEVATLFD